MVIDFTRVLTDLDDKVMIDAQTEDVISLRLICTNALLAQYNDETNLSGEEKFLRYQLAKKVNCGKPIDISPEDVVKIRTLIGKGYGALIVGKAFELLDSPA